MVDQAVDSTDDKPAAAARAVAAELRHLDPGPLAELRRMRNADGAPVFWRLAARFPRTIDLRRDDWQTWVVIVRLLAILTPKGDARERPPLHDGTRRLGAVLCDGGDPRQDVSEKPIVSEQRLARLLAARGPRRAEMLERMIRQIARTRPADSGVDVVDIAMVLLDPTNPRYLAPAYYQRFDAARPTEKKSDHKTEDSTATA